MAKTQQSKEQKAQAAKVEKPKTVKKETNKQLAEQKKSERKALKLGLKNGFKQANSAKQENPEVKPQKCQTCSGCEITLKKELEFEKHVIWCLNNHKRPSCVRTRQESEYANLRYQKEHEPQPCEFLVEDISAWVQRRAHAGSTPQALGGGSDVSLVVLADLNIMVC